MHKLQRELEALKTCKAQEAMPATTGEDCLPLQGQEPLVRALPILEGGFGVGVGGCSALLGPCFCGKGAQLPRGLETYRTICVQHLCGVCICQLVTKSQ